MLELAQRVDVAALGLADADLGHLCMGKMGRHRHHGDAARYQLRRAPAAGALGFKRERQDGGVLATADYAGIRCRFERPRPLNPFAACRDQRTNGRKGRNGIRRGKPQHSAGGFNPRNENGCDRRVRPHPPPRRSGGPPGCLHPWRTALSTSEFRVLFSPAYVWAYVVSPMPEIAPAASPRAFRPSPLPDGRQAICCNRLVRDLSRLRAGWR
jgi:hypothetical protein